MISMKLEEPTLGDNIHFKLIEKIDIHFDNLAKSMADVIAEYELSLKEHHSPHLKKLALKHNKLANDMSDILHLAKIELSKCVDELRQL